VNELSSNIIKGKDGSAHTMKSRRGTRDVAPFIINPSARWHHVLGALALGKNPGTD